MIEFPIPEALTFDDVLLVPGASSVLPGRVTTATRVTRGIELNIPLVSSAMDTVTMSALAVGGFSKILDWVEERAPLRRNVTGRDVGDTAVYLLSDLSSGVTGQVVHVDCGYSSIGL